MRLPADEVDRLAGELGGILIDCVDGGASVFFMQEIDGNGAVTFFQAVAARVRAGRSAMLVAYRGEALCGLVELLLDTPANQRHRAELSKLMVHRSARWRGLGRALVLAAETEARQHGRTLLSLDTTVGSLAERLYAGLGYHRVGVIPGYALHPNGLPNDAVFFWKAL